MRTNLDDAKIRIPEGLTGAVECSLREVGRIHRSRVLRRAGMTVGSFAVVLGALTAFGLANPALASQIPFIGGLFKQEAANNKVSSGNQNVGDYNVVQEIKETAVVAENTLTVEEGYSDGNRIQLVFTMEIPGITDADYEKINPVEIGKSAVLTVNGTEVTCGLGPINYKDGKWQGFVEGRLPQELREADTLETTLEMKNLQAREKPEEGEQYSEENLPRSQPLDAAFTVNFTVTADKAHEFAFTCAAEDNGAKVLGASGTPIQTVISIEKPFWGNPTPHPEEDGAMGFPELLTMDGRSVQCLYGDSKEQGGYELSAQEAQTADLYFDGLPAGTKQMVLRFHESNYERKTVLAEFLIDLEAQTATASKTYQEEGNLNLNNPYAYMSLQMGNTGETQNGITLLNVCFDRYDGVYNGSVHMGLDAESLRQGGYRVAVSLQDGTPLFAMDCVGESGEGWGLRDSWFEEETLKELSLRQSILGVEVPIGAAVVTTVSDLETGETLMTDSRTLEHVQYN